MTSPTDRQRAILALIAARLELEISEQQLKRVAVMQNQNTLRRLLRGTEDVRLSSLIEAADGVNCDLEIVLTRKTPAILCA